MSSLSAKHDAQYRLDTAEHHLQKLREILDGKSAFEHSSAQSSEAAQFSFDDIVVHALGSWVLETLGFGAPSKDVSDQARWVRAELLEILKAAGRLPAQPVEDDSDKQAYEPPNIDIFTDEDLYFDADEDLSPEPVDIGEGPG